MAEEHETVEQQPEAPARLCAACAAPLQEGQDWCLECGSAQPGRLGQRAGWRAAVSVMGATGVLALGAGAAAYAALSNDATRDAASAPPPAAAPVVSTPPAQTAPAPPAETTPEVDAPDSEPADVPDVEAPPSDPVDVPDVTGDDFADDFSDDTGGDIGGDTSGSGSGTGSGSGDTSGDGGDGTSDEDEGTTTEPEENGPGLQSIPLSAGAASTYDPQERGGELVGDPADAIDGKATTAWEAPVDPEGAVGIGLLISLDQAKLIKKLEFGADTPGFEVEIYASAQAKAPATLATPGWAKIGTRKDVGLESAITIGRRPYRHVLLWIVSQPADSKVAIPEVELLQ